MYMLSSGISTNTTRHNEVLSFAQSNEMTAPSRRYTRTDINRIPSVQEITQVPYTTDISAPMPQNDRSAHHGADRSQVRLSDVQTYFSAPPLRRNEDSYQGGRNLCIPGTPSDFLTGTSFSNCDTMFDYRSFPQSTWLCSHKYSPSPSNLRSHTMILPNDSQAWSNILYPVGMEPQGNMSMSSYSSFGGWNGVSHFENASPCSPSTLSGPNIATHVSPSTMSPWSGTTAPEYTQTGRLGRGAPANQTSYNLGPEPHTGGNSLPACSHWNHNNERVCGHSPANPPSLTFIPLGPELKPKLKTRNHRAKTSLVGPKGRRGKEPKPLPKSSFPSSSSPTSWPPSSTHTALHPSKVPCPYGDMHCKKTVCSLATVLAHSLRHWVVHVRDELQAIANKTIKLCDGRIVNTHQKYRAAEQYLTHFCPTCHKAWSRAEQVRNHIQDNIECSMLAYCGGCKGCNECYNCLVGDFRCENCKPCAKRRRELISGAYLQLAKTLGYRPPRRLDINLISEVEVQEQELEGRCTLDEEDDGGMGWNI
ncbi:hypothetical protein BU17DRAFT_65888 [Hysterangium stoloniferum]|nr:hypothetical protein BU17DRAFT_65888 [Hysterangium stoloniferum]